MNNTYWKHQGEFYAWIFVMFFAIAWITCGIILVIHYEYLWPVIVVGLLFLIFAFYLFLIEKRTLSKILLSEKGILWTWLNKKNTFY